MNLDDKFQIRDGLYTYPSINDNNSNRSDLNQKIKQELLENIEIGNIEKCQKLLQSLKCFDEELLTQACKKGLTTLVELFIQKFPTDFTNTCKDLVFDLCYEGQEEIALLLIKAGASLDGEKKIQGQANGTESTLSLLHVACFKNLPKIVQQLIQHLKDLEIQTEKGLTPLHFACTAGHLSIVQLLNVS